MYIDMVIQWVCVSKALEVSGDPMGFRNGPFARRFSCCCPMSKVDPVASVLLKLVLWDEHLPAILYAFLYHGTPARVAVPVKNDN